MPNYYNNGYDSKPKNHKNNNTRGNIIYKPKSNNHYNGFDSILDDYNRADNGTHNNYRKVDNRPRQNNNSNKNYKNKVYVDMDHIKLFDLSDCINYRYDGGIDSYVSDVENKVKTKLLKNRFIKKNNNNSNYGLSTDYLFKTILYILEDFNDRKIRLGAYLFNSEYYTSKVSFKFYIYAKEAKQINIQNLACALIDYFINNGIYKYLQNWYISLK